MLGIEPQSKLNCEVDICYIYMDSKIKDNTVGIRTIVVIFQNIGLKIYKVQKIKVCGKDSIPFNKNVKVGHYEYINPLCRVHRIWFQRGENTLRKDCKRIFKLTIAANKKIPDK